MVIAIIVILNAAIGLIIGGIAAMAGNEKKPTISITAGVLGSFMIGNSLVPLILAFIDHDLIPRHWPWATIALEIIGSIVGAIVFVIAAKAIFKSARHGTHGGPQIGRQIDP